MRRRWRRSPAVDEAAELRRGELRGGGGWPRLASAGAVSVYAAIRGQQQLGEATTGWRAALPEGLGVKRAQRRARCHLFAAPGDLIVA